MKTKINLSSKLFIKNERSSKKITVEKPKILSNGKNNTQAPSRDKVEAPKNESSPPEKAIKVKKFRIALPPNYFLQFYPNAVPTKPRISPSPSINPQMEKISKEKSPQKIIKVEIKEKAVEKVRKIFEDPSFLKTPQKEQKIRKSLKRKIKMEQETKENKKCKIC